MIKTLKNIDSSRYLKYLLGLVGLVLWGVLVKYSLMKFLAIIFIAIMGFVSIIIKPERVIPIIIISLALEDWLNSTLGLPLTNILILLGIVIIIMIKGKFKVVSKKSLFLITCLFISSIISVKGSIVPAQSFRGTIPFIGVLLIAILMNNYIIRPDRMNKLFLKPYLVSAIILSIYGVLQVMLNAFLGIYIGGYIGEPFLPQFFSLRATATFLNPNKFVFFLEPAFVILFYKLINSSKQRRKYKFKIMSYLVIVGLGIFLSGSKGAVLACILTITFIILSSSNNKLMKRVVVFFILILSFAFIVDLLQEFIYFQDSYNTTKRLFLWKQGLDIFMDKPIFGNGIDSFRALTRGDYVQHNTYIQLISELGIVGTSIFASIIMSGSSLFKYKTNYFSYKEIKYGLYSLLIHAVTFNALNSKLMWIFIICLFLASKKGGNEYG